MILMSLLVAISAHAEPSENAKQTLTRSSKDALVLQTKLQKNIYRQEPYQDTYEEQVPYDVEETYYVDIPYQTTETYTDYEEYYDSEYRCDTYTEYERQCHNEQRCNYALPTDKLIPFRERPPGTGPAPYEPHPGRPSPRPEPPSHGGGGGGYTPPSRPEPRPPSCHTEYVCNNVPVTRQRCGYENVRKTRPVTRTRTVTRYRQEARTRTVTRYRSETRCCVTRYKDVFDHQWNTSVEIQFPQGTELLAGEQEQFKIELMGEEKNPDVKVTPVTTVFGYLVSDKKVTADKITIVLSQVPRFAAGDLKEKTLQNFQAIATRDGLSYRFYDNALFPRIKSTHILQVREADTKRVVAETESRAISQREVSGTLALNWNPTAKYEVILKVQRIGKEVIDEGTVNFELAQPIEMLVDKAALKSSSNISARITGSSSKAQLVLKDATLQYASVVTKYEITFTRKNWLGMKKTISNKTISRTSLKADAQGQYMIPLSTLGVSSSDMKEYFKSGEKVQIDIDVTRTLSDGSKIRISKEIAETI
ncbi:hypothetical protein [Bdellovibrio sp. HCB2-146]|uniref:hypothetical protein n=1 Tax=Bdellovibrio sp. HCB2-146 TaxID=3394362 RepID=UPI0039BC2AC8